MEKRIKDRFQEAILQEAMARFGIRPGNIRLLDGFESFIYEFIQADDEQGGGEFILRIGHSLRRNIPLIQGEVDWINALARGGAGVARAVESESGNLVEAIKDGQGEHFLATAFVKAHGHPPRREEWTPAFSETYGRLIGRLHAITREYQPSSPESTRPQWDDPVNMQVETLLPDSEGLALQHYQNLMAHLRSLPRDESSYGLIHQDAHTGNLFVDEDGQITLFDFDDCCYGWFIYDIAMVLFYAAPWEGDVAAFTESFMQSFLRGYRQEYRLDPAWLRELPSFLKLREIDLYAVIHRSFDLENIDSPWVRGYMKGRKERIDAGVPYINYDFMRLAKCLE
jgi:amicoumacin kinase